MLNKEVKLALTYSAIAITITWILWITSFLLAKSLGIQRIDIGMIVELFHFFGSKEFLPKLLFTLAVYGPLLSTITFHIFNKNEKVPKLQFSFKRPLWWLTILLLPLIFILFAVPFAGTNLWNNVSLGIIAQLPLLLLSNLLTSGFEEPLWRGIVAPLFRTRYNLWDTAVYSGIIWALWHFPYVIYQSGSTNLFVVLPTLAGFTMSIVAASYIYTYIYEKSQNILLLMVLHAVMNVTNLFIASLAQSTPILAILPHVLFWGIVLVIDNFEKRNNGHSKTN